jgi:hypothetical protein
MKPIDGTRLHRSQAPSVTGRDGHIVGQAIPDQLSPRVAALLKKMQATRGRLIFALDATGSREPTWDLASQLQASMFEEAAKIGGLDVQLVYYRSYDEVRKSSWLSDAHELVSRMSAIRCMTGATKIARVLRHIRTEKAREKVTAAIFIGDAVEEPPSELYDVAADLGVRTFWFQEGDGEVVYLNQRGEVIGGPSQKVEQVFRELARLTGGAYGKFDAGAAKQLGELLRAIAVFAVGGITALANQHTNSARTLLDQMKK